MKIKLSTYTRYLLSLSLVNYINACTLTIGTKSVEITETWDWKTHGINNDIFTVSFCKTSCKTDAYACKQTGDKSLSYGKPKTTTYPSSTGGEFEFLLTDGDLCPSNSSRKLSAKVIVSCGRTLGQLEFIEESDCTAYFEFSTNEVCSKKLQHDQQIPCYIFNDDNQKIDLTSLQRVKGGITAMSFGGVNDFQFNLCADIQSEKDCNGMAACVKHKNSTTAISAGQIDKTTKLKIEGDQVVLKYETSDNCSTTVRMICPTRNVNYLLPYLIPSASSCNYEVTWATEHACPIKEQMVRNTCKITTNGDEYDLSVLKQENEAIQFSYVDKTEAYNITLNVCGPLAAKYACNGDSKASVCQTRNGESKVLGSSSKSTLRFTDQKLIYTMQDGAICGTNFKRTTVIAFKCDINALDNKPTFDYEDSCTYFFIWRTNHACPYNRELGSECRVTSSGNNVYDLTMLAQSKTGWKVEYGKDNSDIRLNICGLLTDNTCGPSSICNKNNKQSLGKYNSKLQLLPNNELSLTYTDGFICDGKPVNTSIILHCAPGQTTESPMLTNEGCDYQITWNTAYACPLEELTAHGCSLWNTRLQFNIDLSHMKPPNGKYFSISTGDYEYQLELCHGSKETACNAGTDNKNKNVALCQHPNKTQSGDKIVGMKTDDEDLRYYGGFMSMLVTGGDKCNSNHKNRSAEIIFICKYSAGLGKPVFEKEKTHCFYRFIWETRYACSPRPGICSIMSDNKLYDLSALTRKSEEDRQDRWMYNTLEGTYNINVCRPYHDSQYGCSPFSGICFKSKNNTFIDYGSVDPTTPLTLNSAGDIVMKYFFDDGNCSIELTFTCSKDGLGAIYPNIVSDTACAKYFIWKTTEACPKEDIISKTNDCKITTSDQYVYNLSILAHPYEYNITVADKNYHINICQRSTSCDKDTAACVIDASKNKMSIGKIGKKLQIENERLSLEYQFGSQPTTRTIIKFYCNLDQKNNLVKFEKFDAISLTYFFTMDTNQACRESELQCEMNDGNGKYYNMEPLRKTNGYWSALSRSTTVNWFYLNLCTPMHNFPLSNICKLTPSRGCVKMVAGDAVQFTSRHMKVFDQTIIFQYTNTKTTSLYQATVIFHCSTNQGVLYFQMSKEKSMIFNWLTPAACPIRKQVGSTCKVSDNRNEHEFDLSSLEESTITFPDDNGNNIKLHINICKKATRCKTNDKTGACLEDTTNKMTLLGEFNEALTLTAEGQLMLNYTSTNSFVLIKFLCDDNAKGKLIGRSGKGYIVEVPTKLACIRKDIECSLTDPTKKQSYDFSPLSKQEFNWQAYPNDLPLFKSAKVYINVCRPLARKDVIDKCSHSTGICVVKNDGQILNIGRMEKQPSTDANGDITLDYINGDICENGKRFSAKIKLYPSNQNTLGRPILNRVDGCQYHFDWYTSSAWHILHGNRSSLETNDCKVENKLSGYVYDFKHLSKLRLQVTDPATGVKFDLKVCGTLEDTKTKIVKPHSSICRLNITSQKYEVDCFSNENVIASDNILYMKFSNTGNKTYLVNFICDPTMNPGAPILTSDIEKDNVVVFVWRTIHACEHMIQCDAFGSGGKTMNLDGLRFPGYYEVGVPADISGMNSTNKLRINICQNIISKECPHQSASCSVSDNKNLGVVGESPSINDAGNIVLIYKNGDTCDGDRKFQSIVTITCDKQSKAPAVVLKSKIGCIYNFAMTTSLVCKDEIIKEKDCVFKHGDEVYDFNVLKKKDGDGEYRVKSTSDPLNWYNINICAKTSITDNACKDAAVCLDKGKGKEYKSYGSVDATSLKVDNGLLILISKTSVTSSTINFICDEMQPLGYPAITDDQKTTVSFEWKTSLFCSKQELSESYKQVTSFFKEEYDISVASYGRAYIHIAGYRSNYNKPEGCPHTAAFCLKDGKNMYVLGLLSQRKLVVTESSAELRYSQSNWNQQGCSLGASVVLTIACGTKTEVKFDQFNKETCEFHFKAAAELSTCKISSTQTPDVTVKTITHSTKKPSSNVKKNGAAIAVLAVCIVAAIFLICCGMLLSSSDRRITFVSTIRAFFCVNKPEVPSYKYQKLNVGDSDEELETLVEATDAPRLPMRGRDSSGSYRDEDSSDEELLRL